MTKLKYMLAMLSVVCLPAAAAAQDAATLDELKKLDGVYRLVRGEDGGMALPEEVVKMSRLTINGDQHRVQIGNDSPMVGTHKINPYEKPSSIDSTDTMGRFDGKTIKGIYKLDGNELTVCFAPPDQERPKEFSTQNRPGRILHVWKRGG